MKHYLGRVYLAYAGLLFVLSFLLLFPFFWVCIKVKPLQPLTVFINKVWCILFFPPTLVIPYGIWKFRPKANTPYVYVANHSSYFDIPILTWLLPDFICFIGKKSLTTVPLFGFYFNNLHISVDRKDGADRSRSVTRALEMVDKGRPVVVFPEGHIGKHKQPGLAQFRDGAFRVAIEKQIPIIPVTIPFSHIIFPSDGKFSARWHRCPVTIHEPIITTGLTLDDVPKVREEAAKTIQLELNRYHNL